MIQKVVIHTDGGAKGNPGPAAIGVVIDIGGDIKEYHQAIGRTTNNVAEYRAVLFALQKLKQLLGKDDARKAHIKLKTDSELVTQQINGKYKVKNEQLKALFIDLWNLLQDFDNITISSIPREQNDAADNLVNKALF